MPSYPKFNALIEQLNITLQEQGVNDIQFSFEVLDGLDPCLDVTSTHPNRDVMLVKRDVIDGLQNQLSSYRSETAQQEAPFRIDVQSPNIPDNNTISIFINESKVKKIEDFLGVISHPKIQNIVNAMAEAAINGIEREKVAPPPDHSQPPSSHSPREIKLDQEIQDLRDIFKDGHILITTFNEQNGTFLLDYRTAPEHQIHVNQKLMLLTGGDVPFAVETDQIYTINPDHPYRNELTDALANIAQEHDATITRADTDYDDIQTAPPKEAIENLQKIYGATVDQRQIQTEINTPKK